MSSYTIKDLEALSGIKAHTIRIWEQRYKLLIPKRSSTNIRTYNDVELCKLLNIATLLSMGNKISTIASYSQKKLHKELDVLLSSTIPDNDYSMLLINRIISSGLTYSETEFNLAFSKGIDRFGLIQTYKEIIYPVLVRLGLMWNKEELIPSQEHFITNLIKQKIYTEIDNIKEPIKEAESWVLFLPEDEIHEIGLLMANFLLKFYGKKVYYLGQQVPIANIKSFIDKYKPDNIQFFLLTRRTKSKAQEIIDNIYNLSSPTKVYLSGNKELIKKLELPKTFHIINSLEDFIQYFKS
jgi:DNA-binding transcriptional MerR regulator